MTEYAREMNYLLAERKNSTKKDVIQFIDNYVHQLTLKERKKRQIEEERNENLPYIILNGHFNDEWWNGWQKRLYPGERWTDEEKERFIDDEWIHVTSPYDCSGQWFTQRIEVFNVPAGVVVYLFEAIDC